MKQQSIGNARVRTAVKKFLFACFLLLLSLNVFQAKAQLSGIKTIPGTYASLTAAVADLNAQGVGGSGVTFNIAAGYTELLTARLDITATGTSGTPIVFVKSGAGADPVISSYVGSNASGGATPDGMIALIGSDYVTFDGIDLAESAGNTTGTTQMEYGYGLFKASGTDGANNNTIQNCTITLNRNNIGPAAGAGFITGAGIGGSMGIAVACCTPTTGTTLMTVTATSGASSNNHFYHNTIQNVMSGIDMLGYNGASPYTLCDFNNDIGGSSAATGNTIINFGGGTGATLACAAVYFSNQYSLNVSYNTVNNNNGSGANHATTNRGIWAYASSIGASCTINNNTVTITGGSSTSAIDWCIDLEMAQSGAAGNTISINNNSISATKSVASTVAFTAIWVNTAAATVNVNGNTISNFTYAGTGTSECILSQLAGIGTLNINNNIFSGTTLSGATGNHYGIGVTASTVTALNVNSNSFSNTTLTGLTSKIFREIYVSTAGAGAAVAINSNNFQGISYSGGTPSGEFDLIYGVGTALTYNINNNTFTGSLTLPTTGSVYLIYNSQATGNTTITNNNLTGTGINKTGAGGTFYGYYNFGTGTGTTTLSGNTWNGITVTGATTVNVVFLATVTTIVELFQNNTISNITGGTSAVELLHFGYGQTGSEISGNTLSGATGASSVTAMNIVTTASNSLNIFNNNINTLTTTGAAAATGILHTAGLATNMYQNKIYNLNANNAGATAVGISVTGATAVNIYNNLISGLNTTNTSGANQLIGMSLSAGTTLNVYYNTVLLSGSSSGANFGTSALYVTTSPTTVNVRNNIFINNCTPAGTGLTVAYRRSATGLTNYASTSNNNNFYAGTPGASNLIFTDGTNPQQTLGAYKAFVAPIDNVSATENTTFLSTAGANSNFLHVDPSVPTWTESGAASISGYSLDYDVQTRNASTPDIGADEFNGIAQTIAAPITFGYNTATTSSFNITWVDNSTSESNFQVYRSLNVGGPFSLIASVPSTTTPGTGTTYSLAQTGLLGNTTYYYQVYANGGPNSAALTGSAATLPCGSGLSGTKTIPGDYPTITAALAALVSNGLSGPLVLELQPGYTSAGESFPITLGSSIGCLGSSNTLTIRPAATVSSALLITSSNTTATIDINGGNFVTIDGRPGGTGSNQYLIVENTSTTAASAGNAILIRNESSSNTLTYLEIRSANGNAAANTAITTAGSIPGAVAIASTTNSSGAGNDYNTISYCNIHSTGANLGVCIYAGNSNTAGSSANNDFGTITNCNLYDFFLAGTASAGLDISQGNNNWTVTNNSVYQSATQTFTNTQNVRGFWITPNITSITSASGFTINNNYIGGRAPLCGGSAYTITGSTAYNFYGMDISLGLGTTSNVQGNTVTNLNITGAFSGNAVYGINIANGNVNIGTTTGNLIGSTTTNGSITVTTSVTGGSLIGLRSGAGGTLNFSNNTVSGIDMIGNATTIATGFNGIAGSGGANIIINNNVVGSATLANSINMVSTSATSSTAVAVRGIICNSATGGVVNTITNNLVANINNNYSATGSQTTTLVGISVTTGTSTISGNTIRNLTSNTQTTNGGTTAGIDGIAYTSSTAPTLISGNAIYALKLTNASVANASAITNQAIAYTGPGSGSNIIEKNLIHSIGLASTTNSGGFMSGMDIGSGTVTIQNNMIRLGVDENGASLVAPCTFRGISNNSGTSNIWFNSIYIGGTGVGTATTNTFAYARTGAVTTDVRDNIFVNNRSNATTGGKHYSVNLNSNTTLTMNYNVAYGNGTGYIFGAVGATDYAAYSVGWVTGDNNSWVADPMFINPTGNTASIDLHINPSVATIVESTGTVIASVTTDYDNQTRSGLTPTDIGADAGVFISSVCNGTPPSSTATVSGSGAAICLSGTSTITLTGYSSSPGLTYQWQSSTTSGGPYTNVSGGSGGTTNAYTTPVLTQSTYYICIVTCSNGGASTNSSEASVAVNNPTILTTTPGSNCGPGTVTLGATGSNGAGSLSLNWYNAASGGNLLQSSSATTFVTPNISSTTSYYVAASSGGTTLTGGKPNTNGADGTNTTGGIYFTVTAAMNLSSVVMYPTSAGTSTMVLYSGSVTSGTAIYTTNYTFSGANSTGVTVPLGWAITPGTYTIYMSTNGGNCWRDYSGGTSQPTTAYPYAIGSVCTLTDGSLAGYYYFFYHWTVTTGCESPRIQVTATINPAPSLSVSAPQSICNNTIDSVKVTAGTGSYSSFIWSPTANLYTNASATNAYTGTSATTLYFRSTVAGTYSFTCNSSGGGCSNVATASVTNLADLNGSSFTVTQQYDCNSQNLITVNANTTQPLLPWYSNDFTSSTLNATQAQIFNNATISGGVLQLNGAAASQKGAIQIFNPSAINASAFQIDFDLTTVYGNGNADGLSYSFGDDVVPMPTGTGSSTVGTVVPADQTNPENGSGTKLKLSFDAYVNGANTQGIYLMYNCPVWNQTPAQSNLFGPNTGVLAYAANTSWFSTGTTNKHVSITITSAGLISVTVGGVSIFSNIQLPGAYLAANKSTWTSVFAARTGSVYESHIIDNFNMQYFDLNYFQYSNTGGSTWQSGNIFTVPTGSYPMEIEYTNYSTCPGVLGNAVVSPTTFATQTSSSGICAYGASLPTLSFTPSFSSATYQWESSPAGANTWSTIAGATSATYSPASLLASTDFRCNIYCIGNPIAGSPSIPVTVTVVAPAITGTTPGTHCGAGTVSLQATATSGSTINWYNVASGGAPIATGSPFVTPVISTSTNYYVSASFGGNTLTGGKPNTNGADGTNTTGGIYFTANSSFSLTSVVMYPTSAGTTTIVLYSGSTTSGTAIYTVNYAFTGANSAGVTVPLNWAITPGNYTIYVPTNGGNCWRDYSGGTSQPATAYPYTIGSACTLTDGSLTGYYYFFYHWTISTGCEGPRTTVLATITTPPSITASAGASAICLNGSTSLNLTNSNDPNYTYAWTSNPSGFNGTGSGPFTVSPTVSTTYTVTATDNVAGPNFGCIASANMSVTVNPLPAAVVVTPTTASTCPGAYTQLTATGGTSGGNVTGVISGTSPTTSTGSQIPFYRLFEGSHNQYLITAAELSAQGFTAGNFNSMSFNVTTVPGSPTNLDGYTLSIAPTANTSLSAFVTTGFTTVYTTGSYTPVVGANTFAFSSNFNWNGTSNIVIDEYFDDDPNNTCTAGSPVCWGNTPTVSMVTAPMTSTVYYYADNTTGPRNIGTIYTVNGTTNSRPVITLGFINLVVNPFTWSPLGTLHTSLNGPLYTGTQTSTVFAAPASTTTYYATATDGNGCTSQGSATITTYPTPVPTVTATNPICTGSSLSVGSNAYNSYSWTGPNGFSSSNQTALVTNSASSVNNGTYTLAVVDGNGCAGSNSVSVTVIPNTLSVAAAPTLFNCTNNTATVTLTVSGGAAPYTLSPSTPITGNSISLSGQAPGAHTYTVTDANGCIASINITTSGSTPQVGTVSTDQVLCSNNAFNGSISSASGYLISWQSGNTSSGPWTTVTTNTLSYTSAPLLTGSTYYRVVASTPGCVSVVSNTVRALVDETPTGASSSNVTDVSAVVTVSGANGSAFPTYNLTWNGGGSASNVTLPYTITGLNAGSTYTVHISYAPNSCGTTPAQTTFTTICTSPVLQATLVNNTHVSLNWNTPVANTDSLVYRNVLNQPWHAVSPTLNPYTLSTTYGTTYAAYIKHWCGGAYINSPVIYFTTGGALCTGAIPVMTSLTPLCASRMTATWSNTGAATYKLTIHRLTPTVAVTGYANIVGTSYVFNTIPGATYEVMVQGQCSASSNTPSSVPMFATAPALLLPPDNVITSAQTCSGFTVAWTPVAGASGYKLKYTVGGSTNTMNLGPVTSYTFYYPSGVVVSVSVATIQSCLPNTAVAISDYGYSTTGSALVCKDQSPVQTGSSVSDLQVYPNPNSGEFNVSFSNAADQEVNYTVLNLLGQTVYLEKNQELSGSVNHTIRLSKDLSAGMYYITIQTGNEVTSKQIMIVH